MKTSCKNFQNQFISLLSDELAETKQHAVQQHLDSCDECRDEYQQFKNTWGALAEVPRQHPDEDMEEQFNVMLRAYKRGMQETGKSFSSSIESIKALFFHPAWKFAVPILMLAVGFLLGSFKNWHQDRSDYVAISNEMDDMRQLVMLSLLKQESSVDRLQAVNWSYQVERPKDQIRDALCRTLTQDANANVRLAALRALQPYAHDPIARQDIINSFPQQSFPLVQTGIIDFIRKNEERPAELLKILAQDKNLNKAVKQHLQWNIGMIEGETFYKENSNEISTNLNRIYDLPSGRQSNSK
jgi:hypothetical protein